MFSFYKQLKSSNIKFLIDIVFIISGLNHEQNIKKMRILTFMQMAESNPEISFDDIISELAIENKDVEAFIIEGKTWLF